MLLRLAATGLLLVPLLSRPAAAQAPDPTFTPPVGLYAPATVYALGPSQADAKRLVAGPFTRVNGTAASGLVRLDAAGAIDQAFSQNLGLASNIYRVRSYGSGQYLLGAYGGSVTAGGISRVELLRLNANGTADASFDAGSGPAGGYEYVNEFAVQPDGKVVVTGSFDHFGAAVANGVARLNADGSLDPTFNVGAGLNANAPDFSEGVTVAVQADGKILVGGYFTTFNGLPFNGLVRLNANGTLDTSFPNLAAGSYAEGLVVQPDGKLLVSGGVMLNGTSYGLVRLNPNGSLDAGFATSFTSGEVSAAGLGQAVVLQPDGKVLVSGYFSNGAGNTNVVRLNANGTLDAGFQAPAGNVAVPNALGLQPNGSVLLGGPPTVSPSTEIPLLRLSSTGTADPAFAPRLQVAGTVAALVRQPDGRLIIGGSFTEIGGLTAHRLARLTATGALDAGYTAATGVLPAPVTSLALQPDGKVLAGTTRGVVRFATTGSPDLAFSSFTTLNTTALALQTDGKVLAVGPFSGNQNGVAYERLVRLTSTGAYDPTFARNTLLTSPTGALSQADAVLVQPDGRIVVGGIFRTASPSTAAGRVVRYETTGALDATFANPTFTATNGTSNNLNRIYALALQPDGKIVAGGNFGAVDGTLHYGVARLGTTGVADATFVPNALLTGTVYSVAVQPNGRVLAGGLFSNSGPSGTSANLVRFLANGQTDASFTNATAPGGTVRSLVVQPDGAILLAGSFFTLGGQPAAPVARLTAPNVLHVAAPAAVAARTAAWPVPAHTLLHVAPDASAQPRALDLLDALGRPVRHQTLTSAAETTLDVAGLPAGVYLLRVHYAAGTVTRRLAVE